MMITPRNTARAMNALVETVLLHLEPTTAAETCGSPVTLLRSLRTLATWSWGSDSVCTITCGGVSVVTCTTLATDGPTASRTWATVTGLADRARNTAPPLKSMPNFRPGMNRAMIEISTATPEMRNQRRHWPTKSMLVSPWYRRLARDDTGTDPPLDGLRRRLGCRRTALPGTAGSGRAGSPPAGRTSRRRRSRWRWRGRG